MSVTTASQVPGPALISPSTEITIPPLPTWSDATSVATFLTALVAILVGGLTLFDPSIVPNVTSLTQALIPSVAGVIAGVVVIANIARHALVHIAAVKAVGAVKVARVTAQSSLI